MKIGENLLARNLCCVMGLPFDVVTTASAVDVIRGSIVAKTPCFLSTPNLNFTVAAQSDPDFYQSVVQSDLIVADGMPIVWVAKLLGLPLPERVAGSSLFDALANCDHATPLRVFFFGGLPGIAEQACQRVSEKFPGTLGCGHFDPGFGSVEDMSQEDIILHINQTKPDFVVVALGAKKGQQWILQNRHKLNAPVVSHLGAVVNFVAGQVTRAPVLVQKLGFEWLWRIKEEPQIWRRYWQDGKQLIRLFFKRLLPLYLSRKDRAKTKVVFCQRAFTEYDNYTLLKLSGDLGSDFGRKLMTELVNVAQPNRDIRLDLSELMSMCNSFLAFLLVFAWQLANNGGTLSICKISNSMDVYLIREGVKERFTSSMCE